MNLRAAPARAAAQPPVLASALGSALGQEPAAAAARLEPTLVDRVLAEGALADGALVDGEMLDGAAVDRVASGPSPRNAVLRRTLLQAAPRDLAICWALNEAAARTAPRPARRASPASATLAELPALWGEL